MPPASPRLLRRINPAVIVRTIRAGEPVSRAEPARVTGRSDPTVDGAVAF